MTGSPETVFKLVRHALHDHGVDRLCGRMVGVALGAAGRAQLPWLARAVGTGIAAVYSSPQVRCRQTAACFAMPVAVAAGLDEIDFGAWTGRRFAELDDDPAWRRWNTERDHACAPGGEAAAAAQARAVHCVAQLHRQHPGGRVVLVSHGDIIKSILCQAIGLSLQASQRIEITQASVTTLVVRGEAASLASMNVTAPEAA